MCLSCFSFCIMSVPLVILQMIEWSLWFSNSHINQIYISQNFSFIFFFYFFPSLLVTFCLLSINLKYPLIMNTWMKTSRRKKKQIQVSCNAISIVHFIFTVILGVTMIVNIAGGQRCCLLGVLWRDKRLPVRYSNKNGTHPHLYLCVWVCVHASVYRNHHLFLLNIRLFINILTGRQISV